MEPDNLSNVPIGVFDSGVGGLSVLHALRQLLPEERLIYLADQAHVPYGLRSLEQVRSFAEGITRFLLESNTKLVVVACNTASAAALHHLRRVFPETPFVGMEPAVKPAAEQTRSGMVGVLATPATFQGELYASVVERFAQGVTVLQETCPGLVTLIEEGRLEAPETRAVLERALQPMLVKGIDTIVLGCTHYPFVIPLIQDIAGHGVRVIDPAPAIARQVERLLDAHGLRRSGNTAGGQPRRTPAGTRYFTTAAPGQFQAAIARLLGERSPVASLRWNAEKLEPGEADAW